MVTSKTIAHVLFISFLSLSCRAADASSSAVHIDIMGNENCGTTLNLRKVAFRRVGTIEKMNEIFVSEKGRYPFGKEVKLPCISDDIFNVGINKFLLSDRGGWLQAKEGSSLQIKDPSVSVIVPYYSVDFGSEAILTFQNYSAKNGKLTMPPGFGVRLKKDLGAWAVDAKENESDFITLVSGLGYQFRGGINSTVGSNSTRIAWASGKWLAVNEIDQECNSWIVTRGQVNLTNHEAVAGASNAIPLGDNIVEGKKWLASVKSLLKDAENSKKCGWITDMISLAKGDKQELIRPWSSVSLSGKISNGPVYVRSYIPSLPVGGVCFQSVSSLDHVWVYFLSDESGSACALIDQQASNVDNKIKIFELSADALMKSEKEQK